MIRLQNYRSIITVLLIVATLSGCQSKSFQTIDDDIVSTVVADENQTNEEITINDKSASQGIVTKVNDKNITLQVLLTKDGEKKDSNYGMEKEITITDENIIFIDNGDTTTKGSLKDILVGSNLTLNYTKDIEGNDNLSSIIINSFPDKDH